MLSNIMMINGLHGSCSSLEANVEDYNALFVALNVDNLSLINQKQ